MFSLAVDYTAVIILSISLLIVCFLQLGRLSHAQPYFKFPRLDYFQDHSWQTRLLSLPTRLHLLALSSLMLAFIDPHLRLPAKPLDQNTPPPISTEGIAMYLLVDQSGSMIEPIRVISENGQPETLPKIDFLKQVTEKFIKSHASDLIGLVAFARTAHVIAPLTLDQQTLLAELQKINIVEQADEDGTAMGYAIFKTAHLIAATHHFAEDLRQEGQSAYTIKNTVIIVLTDGLQDPSFLDRGNRLRTIELDDAANYVKSENIRLYVVNIDPAMASEKYAPQRRQLQKITELTGGRFYSVTNQQNLSSVYQEIDHLEKEEISQPNIAANINSTPPEKRFSFYPFFIACGLFSLLAALFLQSFVLKVSP